MRWVRFAEPADGRTRYGLVEDDHWITVVEGSPFTAWRKTKEKRDLAAVRLLPPCRPSKIVAVGLNYRDHARELGMPLPEEPVLFLKPPTAVIGPEEEILYPAMSSQVDYEAEVAVVVRDRVRNIRPEEALGHILGVTCFNDVTARDLQKKDGQWTRAKSFDTFAPLGPWIVDQVDVGNLTVELFLNGEKKQSSTTQNLIFDLPYLVSFISRVMTLEPGDVIATGTPAGVGPMQPGDVVEVVISGVGRLRNRVARGR